MWDWTGERRSANRSPGEITAEALLNRQFVFLGARVLETEVSVDRILEDFDRLYPLYKHVESGAEQINSEIVARRSHGHLGLATRTTYSRLAEEISVDLRHNQIQQSLVNILRRDFPEYVVRHEFQATPGCRVDVAVCTSLGTVYCEIKVAPSVRAALREAMGQLLEYTHWPNDVRAKKWWVVSEQEPTAEDIAYINSLRSRYKLPISYRRIDLDAHAIGPEV
jgi:hypothetical protein